MWLNAKSHVHADRYTRPRQEVAEVLACRLQHLDRLDDVAALRSGSYSPDHAAIYTLLSLASGFVGVDQFLVV